MTPAGAIEITLTHRGGQALAAGITSSRPMAARVLLGKTPEQALTMVPLLFSLCGNAQAYAALLACRAALNLPAQPRVDTCRFWLVQLETLREHAWRILLDWPDLLGRQADKSTVAALLKLDKPFKTGLFEAGEAFGFDSRLRDDGEAWRALLAESSKLIDRAVFNGGMDNFLGLGDESALLGWLTDNDCLAAALLNEIYRLDWPALGANAFPGLPELDPASLHAELQQQDLTAFCREPQWQGRCHESTPFSRQRQQALIADLRNRHGNGLLARFAAVLTEVADILRGLEQSGNFAQIHAANGVGLAQVRAARGLLIHRVELRRGCVYDYRIVAPTEWNFHPDGILVQSLKALDAADADDLQRQARWLIQAIDPCVPYKLILNET